MNDIYGDIYYDPGNPASFSSANRLRKAVVDVAQKPIKNVRKWLSGQETYTLHKRSVRKFKRRKTIAKGIDHQWQADLMQLDMLARYNSNYSYVLICIDVFSRMTYVEPIKRKTGQQVTEALEKIFKRTDKSPKLLQVDHGREFYNINVEQLLKKYHVKMFSVRSVKKASLVERVILTLKQKLFKWMTKHKTKRYVDILQDVVSGYNRKVHTALGIPPIDVTKKNEADLWRKQYANEFPLKGGFQFKTGEKVRISKPKKMFEKSYLPQWSEEYYSVARRRATKPVTYQLKTVNGEFLPRSFYEEEMQLITQPQKEGLFPIDILESRKNKHTPYEHFVHYRNFPPAYDRWLDAKTVQQFM